MFIKNTERKQGQTLGSVSPRNNNMVEGGRKLRPQAKCLLCYTIAQKNRPIGFASWEKK
jgi:hypothetical protein